MLESTPMDSLHSAADNRLSFRDAGGQGAIVFDPAHLRQATPALFEPTGFGDTVKPVTGDGGRGAAWFVHGEFGEAVLRQYRRGGLAARLSSDAYLWRGETQVRSFREFHLLRRFRELGLPVPTPYAACYRQRGGCYKAAILVARITGARSFAAQVASAPSQAPWTVVGSTIAQFHRQGAHHSDLNAHNVLLDGDDAVWLIDWDKGRQENSAGPWCARVLARLQRSLHKQCPDVAASELDQGMRLLHAAHDRALAA